MSSKTPQVIGDLYDQFNVTLFFSREKGFSRLSAIQVQKSRSGTNSVSIECLNCYSMSTDFAFLGDKGEKKDTEN